MDKGSIIMGIIMLALVILPFIFTARSKKKSNKKLIESLRKIAEEQGGVITQKQLAPRLAIGIDEIANILYFFKKNKDTAISQVIPINELKGCCLLKKYRTVRNKKETVRLIEKIDLVFTLKHQKQHSIVVELYDAEETFELTKELDLAKKWEAIIKSRLSIS